MPIPDFEYVTQLLRELGAPDTVQRLYQVIFQGFMSSDNFNEIGSS